MLVKGATSMSVLNDGAVRKKTTYSSRERSWGLRRAIAHRCQHGNVYLGELFLLHPHDDGLLLRGLGFA